MLILKKNIYLLDNKYSFLYIINLYKLISFFFIKSLKKDQIWKWPLTDEIFLLNNYINFY